MWLIVQVVVRRDSVWTAVSYLFTGLLKLWWPHKTFKTVWVGWMGSTILNGSTEVGGLWRHELANWLLLKWPQWGGVMIILVIWTYKASGQLFLACGVVCVQCGKPYSAQLAQGKQIEDNMPTRLHTHTLTLTLSLSLSLSFSPSPLDSSMSQQSSPQSTPASFSPPLSPALCEKHQLCSTW